MLRFAAYAVGGFFAMAALHAGFLRHFDPRDRAVERAEPVRITRAPSVPGEATLLFAGDTAETDASLDVIAARGFEYPFSLTVDLFRDADLAVVNQEAPITDGGDRFPIYKDYVYRSPARSAWALAWAGVDVLELANNHAIDFGASGLRDTAANAAREGLVTVGGGANDVDARRGVIVTVGDLRVGVLAFCEDQFLWHLYVDQFARAHHAGVALLSDENLRRDLARLRPLVDVLVVSLHIGEGYRAVEPAALAWSERAIDDGADLVVNHHPHVAQPIAMHRGRPIFLCLGNFAFGTPGQFVHVADGTLPIGLLVLAHARGRALDRVEVVPLAVDNRVVDYRPAPLDGDERDRALARLRDLSRPYGTDLRIERGRGVVYIR